MLIFLSFIYLYLVFYIKFMMLQGIHLAVRAKSEDKKILNFLYKKFALCENKCKWSGHGHNTKNGKKSHIRFPIENLMIIGLTFIRFLSYFLYVFNDSLMDVQDKPIARNLTKENSCNTKKTTSWQRTVSSFKR